MKLSSTLILLGSSCLFLLPDSALGGVDYIAAGDSSDDGWGDIIYCSDGPIHGICSSGSDDDCGGRSHRGKCDGSNFWNGNGAWSWKDAGQVATCAYGRVGYGMCASGRHKRCNNDGYNHGLKCGTLKSNVKYSSAATRKKAGNQNTYAECDTGWYVVEFCGSNEGRDCYHSDGNKYFTVVTCQQIVCEVGHDAYDDCSACPSGTYNNDYNGVTGCIDCPAGEYSSSTGSTSCSTCDAGTYSSAGSDGCTDCPSGRYSTQGSSSCSRCDDGQIPNNGQTACNQCTGNTYSKRGDSSCTDCPAGTTAKSDKSGCDDIDECTGSHGCPVNSECVNIELSETIGGNPYKCQCVPGFSVTGSGGTQLEGQPGEMTCEGVTIPLEAKHVAYDTITVRIQHSVVHEQGTSVTLGCYEPGGFTLVETRSNNMYAGTIRNHCRDAGYKYAGRLRGSHNEVWCSDTYPTGSKISDGSCTSSQDGKLHVIANRDMPAFEFDLEIGRATSAHESEKIYLETKTLQELEAGVTLQNLDPGTPYIYQLKSVGTESTMTTKRITTTCECHRTSETHLEYAGLDRPWGFQPTQEYGLVTFQFQDLSRCEEGFSLTRQGPGDDEEQVFTSTYYYVSSLACGEHLMLGHQNADDLSTSRLPVGVTQRYCVQAVGPGNGGIRYSSEGESCFDHKVLWEASIDGIVRLPQHSGSLPVQGVTVRWRLIRPSNGNRIKSGSLTTDHTGKYNIKLQSQNGGLFTVDGENPDVEVRLKFVKTTSIAGAPLDHTFVCDDGESICSGRSWTSVYVRHLDFGVEHAAVDISSKAITGKVVIAGTGRTIDPNDPPADFSVDADTECPIIGADVCLQVQNLEVDAGERNCVKTDAEGNFELAAPLGTVVKVEVDYFQHQFVLDQDDYAYLNDGDGFLVEEEQSYANFKFSDVHKAPLRTHIVGGLCDRLLGEAQVIVTLPSCSDWKGQPFDQSAIMQEHYMPAHDVNVKVHIKDRNDIDMESQGFDLRQVVVEDSASHQDGTLSREAQDGLDEEPEEADMLRFQYNGTMEVEAHFTGDTAGETCGNTGTGNSFHVLEAYKGFTLTVKVSQSFGGDIENCDHIPDDTKVQITSNLAPDEVNDAAFLSELQDGILAEYIRCTGPDANGLCIHPKCCLLDIEHTEVSDSANGTVKSNARVVMDLRAGPPNINGDFLKSILIEVAGVSYSATVLLTGDYDDGVPDRTPLPAMDPIMILRDPPGSNSYAYYENIVTTGFVSIQGYSSYYGMHSKYDTNVGGDAKSSMCAGLGAMACQETIAVAIGESGDDGGGDDGIDIVYGERRRNLLSYESDMKILMSYEGEKSESSFQTTWSYQTPENWSGHDVDYFVVPSISLLFHHVIVISFESGTCSGVKDETVKFSAESESKENSVSFLSLADVSKLLLELNDMQDMLQGIIDDPQESVDRHNAATDTLPVVTQALSKWATIVADYQKVNEFDSSVNMVNPADWFKAGADKCEEEVMHWAMNYVPDGYDVVNYSTECKNYLAKNFPSSHWSSLIPDRLKGKIEEDANANLDEFKDIHLLSFSGGGGKLTYELKETFSMDKERLPEDIIERGIKGLLDMVPGMSLVTNGGNSANSAAKTVVDAGVKLNALTFGFKTKYSNTWGGDINTVKTQYEHKLSSKSSRMGFVLQDKDIGDYFDVMVGIDPTHGSFVFKTVGGLSKCFHEEGTAIREQPEIDIISKPTGEILPDQPAVFQVKLINGGETWNEYDLAIARKNNTGGLSIHVNGAPLGVDQLYRFESHEEVPITISVFRGPVLYEYQPVQLQLRSRCERTKFATYDLFTHLNANNEAVIRYAQDCPRMVLDGQLGSGVYMINAAMDREAPLLVQNVARSVRGSLQAIDILADVKVKYRELGSAGTWNNARVEVNGATVDLDLKNSTEDDYGFITDTWPLDQLGDGNYEVMIESRCPSNPAEFQKAHSEIAIIKLDTIPPEPYAFPSETDTYHVGEPMIFEYDETLDCERPYGFGLEVTVSNVERVFTKDNMLVVCEDRMIGIQFDGSQFDLDLLKGETAEVTLSGVRDPNVNEATNDAVVTVTFADAGNRAFRRLTSVPSIKTFRRTNVTLAEPLSNGGAAMIHAKFAEMEEGIKKLASQGGRNDESIKKLVLDEMEAMEDKLLESLYQMGMIFMLVLLAFMGLVFSLLVWHTKGAPASNY